jgi:hypothetical protein
MEQESGYKKNPESGWHAGDLEPTFLLKAGWGQRMEQESG